MNSERQEKIPYFALPCNRLKTPDIRFTDCKDYLESFRRLFFQRNVILLTLSAVN